MRILYLINYAGKAGTEKYVQNLVEAFKEKDEWYFDCGFQDKEL